MKIHDRKDRRINHEFKFKCEIRKKKDINQIQKKNIYINYIIDQNILHKMKLLYKIFMKKETPKNNKNSYQQKVIKSQK